MFWGLIMEPHRRYTQQVKKAFHISMASLDLSTSNNEPSQVMLGYQGRNYLLCTLQKGSILQCALDLNFEVGTEVSFASNGKGHVHLTGYLLPDDLDDMDEGGEEEEQLAVEQESSDESVEEEEQQSGKKRPRPLENGQPNKKSKIGKVSSSQPEEESSDDEDFVFDENAEEEGEEDDDLEEEDEEDEGDSDDEEEEESNEEEEETTVKKTSQQTKVNGIPPKTKEQSKATENSNKGPKKRTLTGGIIVEDLKEGQGPSAKNGKFVSVYYEGRFKSNNKMFDSTKKGSGFSFRLGNGEVIKGWDIGVEGMKQGGKRRIVCPPKMAYGARGSPPAIPPNSTLVFEVELRKVS